MIKNIFILIIIEIKFISNQWKHLLKDKNNQCAYFEAYIHEHITNQVLNIPEINIDENEIPFKEGVVM